MKDEFSWDGSLRDLYIERTTVQDWQDLLDLLKETPYPLSYERGGENQPISARVANVFADRETTHLLSIAVDGIVLNTHFFNAEEIELDIDPREIDTPGRFAVLCDFLCTLSRRLGRDVLLTHENRKAEQILIFRA